MPEQIEAWDLRVKEGEAYLAWRGAGSDDNPNLFRLGPVDAVGEKLAAWLAEMDFQ